MEFFLLVLGFVHPKRCPKCRLIKKIALQNVHSESELSLLSLQLTMLEVWILKNQIKHFKMFAIHGDTRELVDIRQNADTFMKI